MHGGVEPRRCAPRHTCAHLCDACTGRVRAPPLHVQVKRAYRKHCVCGGGARGGDAWTLVKKGIEELMKDEGERVLMVALWKAVKVAVDVVRGFKEG